MLRFAGVACALFLSFAGTAAAQTLPTESLSPEQQMVRDLNAARASHGLPELRYSGAISRSARSYAKRMIRTDVWRHARRKRVRGYRHVCEVLGLDTSLVAASNPIVGAWLGSASHRPIVLGDDTYVGVGKARGRFQGTTRTIWVVRTAKRR